MALNVVHLGNNTLSGLLSFPSATNLTQLFAARNAFTSFGLPQNSTTITRIAIDQNPIAGPLPSAASLPALEQFSASKCNLTGSVFDLGQLPRLKKLCVRESQAERKRQSENVQRSAEQSADRRLPSDLVGTSTGGHVRRNLAK